MEQESPCRHSLAPVPVRRDTLYIFLFHVRKIVQLNVTMLQDYIDNLLVTQPDNQ